jgi:AcrR family transcriptional regulator
VPTPEKKAERRGGGVPTRETQAARRARSRAALLEATARGLSQAGYANLKLDAVAAGAGYTRGALYHQFADKDDLVLATVRWVHETWSEEVGSAFDADLPPAAALTELARRHAVYCRRDIAGVMTALRVEFGARDHPVGDAVRLIMAELVGRARALIETGRREGTIPPGPPATALAAALLAAVEGAVIAIAGHHESDEEIAERVALGVLGTAGPAS